MRRFDKSPTYTSGYVSKAVTLSKVVILVSTLLDVVFGFDTLLSRRDLCSLHVSVHHLEDERLDALNFLQSSRSRGVRVYLHP